MSFGRRRTLAWLAATAASPALARPHQKKRPASAATYGARDDVKAFAAEVAERRAIDAAWIVRQVGQAQRQDAVRRLIMPPPVGVPKNWGAYRDRFVEPRRIAAGAAFWQANAALLQRAEERYGVPPEIVVGIVGVETFYGRITGNFRVIDALATLAFDFPSGRSDRSGFFRGELEEFLVFCRTDGADPQAVKGSFAGAIGWPQFMPGSINRHAVDFDADGHINLMGSMADVIGSVAHYMAAHGWLRGMPTHYTVQPPAEGPDRAALLAPDILPSFTPAQMAERGAQLEDAARLHEGPLALVLLENGGRAPTWVAGTQNFYAVTRYNWSSYYAMAVIALGDAVRRAL